MADFEVTGTITLNAQGMIDSVDELINKLDEFGAKITEIDDKIKELEDHQIKLDILIEHEDKLEELKVFLADLDGKIHDVNLRINIDGQDKIDKLRLNLDELDNAPHDVKVNIDDTKLAEAEAKIELLNKQLDDLKKKENAAKDSGNGFAFSMAMLAPLAIPAAAALLSLAGGAMGLVSAFGSAIVPVGAFALSMKSAYTGITTFAGTLSTSVTSALSNAGNSFNNIYTILDKNSSAFRKLDQGTQDATVQYFMLKNALTAFQNAIKPEVMFALTIGMGTLRTILGYLAPAAKSAGDAIDKFLADLFMRLHDPTFQKFFTDVDKSIYTLVSNFGTAVLNIIEGVTALLDAFLPMGVKISGGFVTMTQKFDTWAQHLSQSKGFKEFVNTVETDGPMILKIIGNIAEIFGRLILALGTSKVNTTVFSTILNLLQKLNGVMGTHQNLTQLAGDLTLVGIAAWKLGPALGPLLGFIATPVGAVVAAIVAIGAAFIIAYNKSKTFRDWVQQNLFPMFKSLEQSVVGMKNWFISIWPEIQAVWNKYGKYILDYLIADFQLIINTVKNAMEFIKGIIDLVLGLLSGNWKQVWKGITEIFGAVGKELINIAEYFTRTMWDVLSAMWKVISGLFDSALRGIEHNFDTNMRTIEGWVTGAYHAVVNTVKQWMADFAGAVGTGLGAVGTFFANLPGNILRWLGNVGSLLLSAGENLIQGFINGIENMFGSVQSTLSSLTNWLTSWKGPPEKDAKLLFDSGQLIIQGFVDGLESKYGAVKDSLGGLTNTLGGSISKNLTASVQAKINSSLQNASTGAVGSRLAGNGTATTQASGATQVVFAAGSIQINNPTSENPGTSLTRTMQAISKFGTIQTPMGMSTAAK